MTDAEERPRTLGRRTRRRTLWALVHAATAAAVVLASAIQSGCHVPVSTVGTPPPVGSAGRALKTAPDDGGSALGGTSWRLVEFQSMDDAIGSVKPADPSLYTMSLNSDGTVALRLNCNRATGSWSAEPGSDPSSGRFQFGPLAATRALCPPPSLDERIVAHAEYVRSYLLKDGRLALSLMADGGIYLWEPDSRA
jgi:heat shock protein HslJ